MSHLLDTHTLLWAMTDPERLGSEARRIIADRGSTLFASAASAWEIATKQRLGKLPQADVLVAGYARHLDRLGVRRLGIDEHQALLAGSLQWSHRDPFDRMLAAQAMLESLTLLTDDSAFAELPGLATLW
ncbi:MAG: type II toxin-antitoxin system VapC family toxin [Protaetiibacter sp.]